MNIKSEGGPIGGFENIFPNNDPRSEMMERIFKNASSILESDDNQTLVRKVVETVKKVPFVQDDFDKLKTEAFRHSPEIFEKYADMLAKEILNSNESQIIITSFGSGIYGDIEKMLDEKLKVKLAGSGKEVKFVGMDTYVPDSFEQSFFTLDTFAKVDKDDSRSFAEVVDVVPGQKLIVIANFVLHHQGMRLPEFLRRCGNGTVVILDEPVDRNKWTRSKNYRFSVIAYDLLANMAINPKWAELFLSDPSEFYVDYLYKDELERFGAENFYPSGLPLTSLILIERTAEVNLFEQKEVAEAWAQMLELDHSESDKSDRVKVAYPYILEWIKRNNIKQLTDVGSGQGFLGTIVPADIVYTGVEPSTHLTDMAIRQYADSNRLYKLGSAYNTGLPKESREAVVSVMVWFHLANLENAAKELFRNLKPGGKFLIITSNSQARKIWESFYKDLSVEGDMLIGKFSTPQSTLQESVIYLHPNDKIADSFEGVGLVVEKVEPIGLGKSDDTKIFVAISGYKK